MGTRFHLREDLYGFSIELHIAQCDDNRKVTGVARPMTFDAVTPGQHSSPAATLERADAQGLMDELWHLGFRPEKGHTSKGQIEATEKHLNDMRAMVATLSKVVLPK